MTQADILPENSRRGFRPITKNQLELILKETESDGRFIVD